MEIFKGQNLINFGEIFPDDDSCLGYLFDLKWKDDFVCGSAVILQAVKNQDITISIKRISQCSFGRKFESR